MKKPKIIIEIEGGNLQCISASQEIEIIVIDHDNLKEGDDELHVLSPDAFFEEGSAHELFKNPIKEHEFQILEFLKENKV